MRLLSSSFLAGMFFVLSVPGFSSAADPVKVGPEIVVTLPGDEYVEVPRVASDPAGNFLVVWEDDLGSADEARAQAFYATGNARGPAFTVSGPDHSLSEGDYDSETLSVAADAAGNFVVAYNAYDLAVAYGSACASYYGCAFTRRLDVNGKLSPSIFEVGNPLQNVYPPFEWTTTQRPEITSDAEGNFVVVWEGYDSDVEGVFGRKLVASGQSNGSVFRVNDDVDGYQGDNGQFDISTDGSSNFSVVWVQDGGSPNPGVHLERFDSQKNTNVAAQLVSATRGSYPRVASLASGETMVLFEADNGDLGARVYDASGVAVGPEFPVASSQYYGGEVSAGGSVFAVVWDGGSGPKGKLFDATGAAISTEFSTTSTTGYLTDVASDAAGNFVVVWRESGEEWRAQRFQVEAPVASEYPLLGKVMVLKNKIPDDFEKSAGKWKASGATIEVPLRGSADDPRCNGDPAGTVKATARFFSPTSGEDTGAIPLPCENWSATGSTKVSGVAKRGYKYSDGKREAGPCNSIKLTGTKSISVSCKGKPGAASFLYDLMVGVPQGSVLGSVTLGLKTYCAEFAPFFDGSDGKKFKGKSLTAPATCS